MGVPSEGHVKCLYIEKEIIPAVFLIFVITTVIFKISWKYIGIEANVDDATISFMTLLLY